MFKTIIVWSEVWSLLIPLAIILSGRMKKPVAKLLVIYVIAALLLNSFAMTITLFFKANQTHKLPYFLRSNHLIYNIHSVVRVLIFGWFIINSELLKKIKPLRLVLPVFILFVIINFSQWEDPLKLGTILSAVESTLLLTLCVVFFLYSITDDSETIWMDEPIFLVCTGVCLYESVNFFIFLFFDMLWRKNPDFGKLTMFIFSFTYIVLCILLAIALHKKKGRPEKINALS